jgi:hypothetical protein
MLGVKIGYRALPQDWLHVLPHKAWFDKRVVAFLELMGLLAGAGSGSNGNPACTASAAANNPAPSASEPAAAAPCDLM